MRHLDYLASSATMVTSLLMHGRLLFYLRVFIAIRYHVFYCPIPSWQTQLSPLKERKIKIEARVPEIS